LEFPWELGIAIWAFQPSGWITCHLSSSLFLSSLWRDAATHHLDHPRGSIARVVFLREPRFERTEEFFLRWLLKNSEPRGPTAPLTVVEIGHDASLDRDPLKGFSSPHPGGTGVSPLEFALFLQSILEFQPTVIAFENVLRWRERDRDQEQVLIDQAMKVPRLLLAAELTPTADPDAPSAEIPFFTQVTGKRGELIEFSGIGRQPSEEIGLIGTTGFINLPEEVTDGIHVPLLFRYRGK
jgi:hypothetical protein